MPIEAYKPLGIISIGLAWLVLVLLVRRWPGNRGMSFSQHAAAHKEAYITMAIMQMLALPLFVAFIHKWFSPKLGLSSLFTAGITLSALGILFAAWVPDTTGWKRQLHRTAAYGAYILFIPLSLIVYLQAELLMVLKLLWLTTMVYMIWCLVYFVFKRKKAYSNHLYLQAIYIGLFHAAILVTSYATS